MEQYPRLTRSQVIAGLRAHAAEHRFVSQASLNAYDKVLLRSIPLHFAGVDAAREAARVPGAPYRKPRAKTGPKQGTIAGRRKAQWSRQRVIDELRRLHREGHRTAHADLTKAGLGTLIHAAIAYAGGLRNARELAGIDASPRRRAKRWWNDARVVAAIQERAREGLPLSSSRAPQRLVTAGRWHFSSWSAALEAAGVDPATVRLPNRHKYDKDEIIARLRRAVRAGSDLRSKSVAKVMKLESVRREFGSLRAAIRAAGLGDHLERRKHGLQKWNRDRVIEVLQERAAAGIYTLTPGLHRVVQLYFGGAEAARTAAGVPSPRDVRSGRHRRRRWTQSREKRKVRSSSPRGHRAKGSEI